MLTKNVIVLLFTVLNILLLFTRQLQFELKTKHHKNKRQHMVLIIIIV